MERWILWICISGVPRIFSWRLEKGQSWGFFKTEDFKVWRFEDSIILSFFTPCQWRLRLKIWGHHILNLKIKICYKSITSVWSILCCRLISPVKFSLWNLISSSQLKGRQLNINWHIGIISLELISPLITGSMLSSISGCGAVASVPSERRSDS